MPHPTKSRSMNQWTTAIRLSICAPWLDTSTGSQKPYLVSSMRGSPTGSSAGCERSDRLQGARRRGGKRRGAPERKPGEEHRRRQRPEDAGSAFLCRILLLRFTQTHCQEDRLGCEDRHSSAYKQGPVEDGCGRLRRRLQVHGLAR